MAHALAPCWLMVVRTLSLRPTAIPANTVPPPAILGPQYLLRSHHITTRTFPPVLPANVKKDVSNLFLDLCTPIINTTARRPTTFLRSLRRPPSIVVIFLSTPEYQYFGCVSCPQSRPSPRACGQLPTITDAHHHRHRRPVKHYGIVKEEEERTRQRSFAAIQWRSYAR